MSVTNKFDYHDGRALNASRMQAGGDVLLNKGFSANGQVDLHVAHIGNFVCAGCKPNGQNPTVINLTSTKAAAVDDDSDSWNLFKFRLDGFTYDTFFGKGTPQDKSRRNWLAQRDGDFSPLPYEQAAKVLFGMGRNADARAILLAKEQEFSKHGKWKWWQKPLRWLWGKLAGYGYEPARTFVSMLAVVARVKRFARRFWRRTGAGGTSRRGSRLARRSPTSSRGRPSP